MPSAQSVGLREFLRSQFAASDPAETIQQIRERVDGSMLRLPVLAGTQVEPFSAKGITGDWVSMPGAATDRVLLYLHGGAYVMGSARTHRDLAARLSRAAGVRVLVPNYRLAPENPYPAAIEDVVAVYGWLLEQGFKPEHIAIGGDSAGGNLAVVALLALCEAGVALPAAAILLSPWTDLTLSGESVTTRAAVDPMIRLGEAREQFAYYVGNHDPASPLISPIFADLHGMPSLLIHVGNDEVLLDDSVRLAERAQAAGTAVEIKVWEGMWHVFQSLAGILPEGQASIDELGAFVKHHLF
ncbi:MAG TPA: alpha/beta hydrolase [Chloroflexia bacterium]|nr:alpha/beta hydrolase [Chloroflexia bacterium]